MLAARLWRATGKIAVDEAVVVAAASSSACLKICSCSGDSVQADRYWRHRGQREGLAAATAEVDLPELAALARLRHPAGAAIAVEGFRVLPDPGDRVI